MKALKYIATGIATIMLLSSCSVVKNLTSDATGTGTNTGTALASLYQIFQSTGMLDLNNLANIINIGKVLLGANALTGATDAFTTDFTSGLIEGSSKLINSGNVQSVLTALKGLSKLDTSALTQAANAATQGLPTQLSASSPDVASTLSQLTTIFKAMK